jgi:peroxiredoxin
LRSAIGFLLFPDYETLFETKKGPQVGLREQRMATILGTQAPDFTLHVTPDQTLSLSELRGRPVVLAFYPADWSPVCGDQMALYNEMLPEFQRYGAELVGISVDGVWCHDAFAKDRHLHFPLLSDFEPKGEVAGKYGAYRQSDGVPERALVVIDKNGIIVKLSFAARREPRSRWHPAGFRRFAEIGGSYVHIEDTGRAGRSHSGPRACAGDARRV